MRSRRLAFRRRFPFLALACAALLRAGAQAPLATPPEAVRFFDQTVENILASNEAAQRRELFDALLASDLRGPIVRGDGGGVFAWIGDAKRVELTGDMTQWRQNLPLVRVADSKLWVLEARLPPAARVDYVFLVDGVEELDALNPEKFQARGERRWSSVWRGPRAALRPALDDVFVDYPRGDDRSISLDGRQVHLHLPAMARYDRARKFPLVLCLNGQSARDAARLGDAIDRLVAKGDMAPVALAMVELDRPIEAKSALDAELAAWVGDRLLARLDEALPTRREPESRLLLGFGWSGALAFHATLVRPGLFGHAASFSAPAEGENGALAKAFSQANPKPPTTYAVVCGSFEAAAAGRDLHAENLSLRSAMAGAGVACRLVERPAGHSFGFWRDEAADLFARAFPPEKRGSGVVQLHNPELPKR